MPAIVPGMPHCCEAEMMGAMKDYAEVQRNCMILNNQLKSFCQAVSSKAAAYKASRLPQQRAARA